MTTYQFVDYLKTPIGTLLIQASNDGIEKVIFTEQQSITIRKNQWTDLCKQQLTEYFAKERTEFNLPLDQYGTRFQQTVWKALLNIPFGKTASYKYIAEDINNAKAVRAVGAANGKNPISIIVPCHRVIGNNQSLTGYAGGLDRKAWLLKHEGIAL
ncbi:methylated-DNA--[protein]-cysteine S-methyltransferase [Marinomonas agarivorans]|nr:methylated-DNA--[protein]-cysteine S-methyltransferase [Marinomonas agarivorans]